MILEHLQESQRIRVSSELHARTGPSPITSPISALTGATQVECAEQPRKSCEMVPSINFNLKA